MPPIEGVRPVIEAIRAGRRRVHRIGLPDRTATPGLRELAALARERGIPTCPSKAGVFADADPYPEENFEALLEGPELRFLVALDRVTDVGNLGSIARSADAAGVTGLILEQRRAPPIGAGALRASAGALEHLRVGRTPNLMRALELAKLEGVRVLAADPCGDPFDTLDLELLRGDLLWVFGSEDRGLREGIRAGAARLVGIPLGGGVGSLGVSAAAAYLLLRSGELRRGSGSRGRA